MNNSICKNCILNQECCCSDFSERVDGFCALPRIIRDDLTHLVIDCSLYKVSDYEKTRSC